MPFMQPVASAFFEGMPLTIEHLDGHVISADEAKQPSPEVKFLVWLYSGGRGWVFDSDFNDGADAARRAEELVEVGWSVRIVRVVLR